MNPGLPASPVRTVLVAAGLALAVPATGQLTLSEVMADPAGDESDEEYVEVRNESDSTWMDLAGWRLGDDDELDRIVDAGWGTLVPPRGFALILDASVFDGTNPYDSLQTSARIVTIEDRSFGRSGWSNSSPERVLLVDPNGEVADEMTYDPRAGRPGHSWERGGGQRLWQLSYVAGGTPGRSNSVSQVAASRVEVEATPDPFDDRLEIRCRLPAAPALLTITVFDAAGRRVTRLRDWDEAALVTTVAWDGRDADGRVCAPGLYVVLVQASHAGRVLHGKVAVAHR